MNLAAYIDALERSARNLPSVLFEWEQIDEDLQAHYAESLVELVASQVDARQVAQTPAEQATLSRAWNAFVYAVCANSRAITTLMGLSALDLLTPPSVSAVAPPTADTQPEVEDCLPLAA